MKGPIDSTNWPVRIKASTVTKRDVGHIQGYPSMSCLRLINSILSNPPKPLFNQYVVLHYHDHDINQPMPRAMITPKAATPGNVEDPPKVRDKQPQTDR